MKHPVAIFLLMVIVGLTGCASKGVVRSEDQVEFVPLTNGVDLAGWKATGNIQNWQIKDGVITRTGNGGGYLYTDKEYGNYVLRFEYKIAPRGNSGLHLHLVKRGRSSQLGGEIQIQDDYGKPIKNTTAGSLYGIYPPYKNVARPASEWNQVEITYIWPRLKVVMNGVLIQDRNMAENDNLRYRARRGPIALQDHGSGVQFRNLWVKDLGGREDLDWKPLFNGKNLRGWEKVGNANWHIEGDTIVADQGSGYLVTKKKYRNFHLWTAVNTTNKVQGGIQIQWIDETNKGYRAVIDFDRSHHPWRTGSVYGVAPLPENPNPGFYPRGGGWIGFQVVARGDEVLVLTNGRVTARFNRPDDKPGKIALQVIDSEGSIQFADLKIKTLPQSKIIALGY